MDQIPQEPTYIGDLIKEGFYDKLVIIGYPYDEGATKCGLKLGHDLGPDSFRRFVVDIGSIINPEYDFIEISKGLPQISDYGNIQILPKTEQSLLLEKLKAKVTACIKRGNIPFIVGGTRDLSYAVTNAVVQSNQRSLIVLFRSKLDLEETHEQSVTQINSLKNILPLIPNDSKVIIVTASEQEIPVPGNIKVVNISSIRNAPEIQKSENMYSARTPVGIFLEKLLREVNDDPSCDQMYISLSMESIQSIQGVSVKSTNGLSSEEAVEIFKVAGFNSQKLIAFDVPDYNPFIEDQNTGRLLATMFYYFALCLSARLQQLSQ